MMVTVYLSLGSNIDRERHIRAAVSTLQREFGAVALSSVYETAAVGFNGDPFYNLVAAIDTDRPLRDLATWLRGVEAAHGRDREAPKFSARTLDIDVLTYGQEVGVVDGIELPRDEILKHAFVLAPLAELAPAARHPALGLSYAELWRRHDQDREACVIVPFQW